MKDQKVLTRRRAGVSVPSPHLLALLVAAEEEQAIRALALPAPVAVSPADANGQDPEAREPRLRYAYD